MTLAPPAELSQHWHLLYAVEGFLDTQAEGFDLGLKAQNAPVMD